MFANIVIFISSLAVVLSAKILVVVPTPSLSHQVVFRPLTQELVNRDHEVTLITTDPVDSQGTSPNNKFKEIDVHDLSYLLFRRYVINELAKKDKTNLYKIKILLDCISKIFIEQLKDKSVSRLIEDKNIKFDLIIGIVFSPATLIFSYIFKSPFIFMSTFGALPGNMATIGSLTHPLLYPLHYQQRIYNLTVWEKFKELYNHLTFTNLHKNQELGDDTLLQSLFGTSIPTVSKLKNNVHMLFLNMHPILLHNQPAPPGVAYIWGIHKNPEKTLTEELQSYLDSSKHGVIYMSFGSNFKTSLIPGKVLDKFVYVFSRLPYNVLWKWDADELPGKSGNIKISKWFPQNDILRHPNLKFFITQGGLQSTDEAINAGVPLVGIPQFSDQVYNTEKYVHFKIGTQLDYKTLTIESLEKAIDTILTEYDSYKRNIIRLRTLLKDQRKTGLDNAIWWIEYVLRHGGAQHLRAPAANMPWTEYYELELVFIMLSGLIFLVTVSLISVYQCVLYLRCLTIFKSNKNKNQTYRNRKKQTLRIYK